MPINPVVQSAFNQLGNKLAGYDLAEATARKALQSRLGISSKNRKDSLLGKRTQLSDQGLTDSSIALNEGEKVNVDYDTYDNNLMTQNATELAQLGLQRTAAQNEYNDAKAKAEADEAAANAALILPTSSQNPGAVTPATPIPLVTMPGMINPLTLPGGTPNPTANTPAPVAPYEDPSSPYYEGTAVDTPYVNPYPAQNSSTGHVGQPVVQANPADPMNWQGIRVAQLMEIINGPDDPNDPLNWKKIAAIQELKNLGGN